MNLDVDDDGIPNLRETAAGTNPYSNDTDGDGLADGEEDIDFDGVKDTLEPDPLLTDTDGDGILDGTEDADLDGVKDAGETSPIDKDTDDDGIPDKAEVDGTWCYQWESVSACAAASHDPRKTGPLDADSDDDGLLDGQEIGLTSADISTVVTVFRADSDPSSTTNPNAADTDGDGLSDRYEDMNLNGRVDSGEPNPNVWDTDGDGLCDGNCSGKGEDKNLNGIRDQDADGNYAETDFLANDSDVDGVGDGAEINGTYCFKGGSCANTAHPLLPLNPDTDGDGLRDGQELAGWMVGIWYERTMEKKENYSVTSNPWSTNADGDGLTDFEEFMNGSDPRKLDTDGDGITDTQEIARKSNITGVEGTPPSIENVTVTVALALRAYAECVMGLCATLYLPDHLELHVAFDASDAVGVDRVTVRVTKLSGVETRTFELGGALSKHFDEAFAFGLFEALVTGADVNITAYDVNGNGAWGEFHQDSVVEAVAKAVVALFSAIAKVIVEAASAFVCWIWEMIEAMMDGVLKPIVDAFESLMDAVATAVLLGLDSLLNGASPFGDIEGILRPVGDLFKVVGYVLMAISLITLPMTLTVGGLVMMIVEFATPMILDAIAKTLDEGNPIGLIARFLAGELSIRSMLENLFAPPTNRNHFDGLTSALRAVSVVVLIITFITKIFEFELTRILCQEVDIIGKMFMVSLSALLLVTSSVVALSISGHSKISIAGSSSEIRLLAAALASIGAVFGAIGYLGTKPGDDPAWTSGGTFGPFPEGSDEKTQIGFGHSLYVARVILKKLALAMMIANSVAATVHFMTSISEPGT